MINWIPFESEDQVPSIKEQSKAKPTVIFKHSTRCGVSSMAKYRLEEDWDIPTEEINIYYLDLIRYRSISNLVAEEFQVHHESPQLILIQDEECTYESSHLDITVNELKEVLAKAV